MTGASTQNSHIGDAKEARDRISKTSRQKGVPKMTRHEDSGAAGRLASGTELQLERTNGFWQWLAVTQ